MYLNKIKVLVKSLVPGTVTYSNDFRHVRRVWTRQGQVISIPADELQESIYDRGVYNLFTLGYLGIDNAEHRKLIGLDDEAVGEIKPFSSEDAKKLLVEENNLAAFRQKVSGLKAGSVDVLIEEAYNIKNISYDKVNIIKELLGVNITNMLNNDQESTKNKN